MEVHGGEGVLRFFQYVADRTDIALGLFNSGSSGYVLTPEEVAQIANEIPAVCAMKEGMMEAWRSKAAHALAPELVIWECDTIVYKAGWLQQGIVGPGATRHRRLPLRDAREPDAHHYWNLIWDGRLAEAIEYALETGLDRISEEVGGWFTRYPGRPDYFTHWGEAFRYAASVIGLPVGDYPHSRPPQGILPEGAKEQIRTTFENAGLARAASPTRRQRPLGTPC